jgi:hypothetical protein
MRYAGVVVDPKAWRDVLVAEVQRWSSMSSDKLLAELHDVSVYKVERDSRTYQIEVELLEDAETYVHVMVAMAGRVPASISPLSTTFIRRKRHPVR